MYPSGPTSKRDARVREEDGDVAGPRTNYARSGDLNIAYQVLGNGPSDLVFIPSWFSHIELMWDNPHIERMLDRLASFSRLILFDQRGTGLSDPVPLSQLPTLEERIDDVRAVLDAVGSDSATIFGGTYSGPLALFFAASHPERTRALVLYNAMARLLRSDDYTHGITREQLEAHLASTLEDWGRPQVAQNMSFDKSRSTLRRLPRLAPELMEQMQRYQRMSLSPGAAAAIQRMNFETDVRNVLPVIRVPTLVMHQRDNPNVVVDHGRYVAERIPGARYVEFDGSNPLWWYEGSEEMVDELEEFVTGERHPPEPDRVLATVLFTDLVSSTEHAVHMGDRRWRDVLETHGNTSRRQVERFRGRLVRTTGDGMLATFDGPARAIHCDVAVRDAIRNLGMDVRAGLHTGEIELMDADLGGIAVHIGARVSALAGPGEVLVSSTVKDLVVGSGLDFEDRGAYTLKGVPGEWRIYRVAA
jgi:class 3 adenylate cyclase/pimeloyl-ACP methyl ester carboxylesterase